MQIRWPVASALALWLGCLLLGFYLFFWQYIGAFDPQNKYPESTIDPIPWQSLLTELSKANKVDEQAPVVFHWLNLNCPCSKYAIDYIKTLVEQEPASAHRILVPASEAALSNELPKALQSRVITLNQAQYQASRALVPSTPSATVFAPDTGAISYIGPHSKGALCGQGESYISLVLNNLKQGFDSALYVFKQTGCFCQW